MESMEEKLDLIDQEIQTLHRFCIDNGFSPRQIERCAVPIWKHIQESRKRRWKILLLKTTAVLGLVAALAYCDPAIKIATACGRIAMIKMLPYWDWMKYYNNDGCLLDNPYFKVEEQRLYDEDCDICKDTTVIGRLNKVSQVVISEAYIKRDIPVIITDGLVGWLAQQLFSLKFLYELYNKDEVLKNVPTCFFASNIQLKSTSAKLFLARVFQSQLTNWYAHWEDCEISSLHILRQFFKRPYFLAPMIETAKLNWILLSSDYNAKNYKSVDMGTPLSWLAQVKGKNKIRLVPRIPCNSTCSTLYTVLHEGEIVVWTDFLWSMDYLPVSSGSQLNIAIASGGFYD